MAGSCKGGSLFAIMIARVKFGQAGANLKGREAENHGGSARIIVSEGVESH